jgi:hypothetical protein
MGAAPGATEIVGKSSFILDACVAAGESQPAELTARPFCIRRRFEIHSEGWSGLGFSPRCRELIS